MIGMKRNSLGLAGELNTDSILIQIRFRILEKCTHYATCANAIVSLAAEKRLVSYCMV